MKNYEEEVCDLKKERKRITQERILWIIAFFALLVVCIVIKNGRFIAFVPLYFLMSLFRFSALKDWEECTYIQEERLILEEGGFYKRGGYFRPMSEAMKDKREIFKKWRKRREK